MSDQVTPSPQNPIDRRTELAKQIAFANALGVRAAITGDKDEHARAKRLYDEAMEELRQLDGIA
jgi:hypothetical protein